MGLECLVTALTSSLSKIICNSTPYIYFHFLYFRKYNLTEIGIKKIQLYNLLKRNFILIVSILRLQIQTIRFYQSKI